jgi:biofilm PGA synthesis N-glycosyltransferase PgaC
MRHFLRRAPFRRRPPSHAPAQRAATLGDAAANEPIGHGELAGPDGRVAVVIASRNGEGSVAETIRSVVDQADVYLVSDGSSDATAQVARGAGARVLELAENVGKPAALYRVIKSFELTRRYGVIAILDDDTVVAADFVQEALKALKPDVAIVVGRTITRWSSDHRWNVWLGCRAYSYWRYQVTIRRAQSAFNVMNCISGSNSVFRASVLEQVLVEKTPYIVDDTYWTLEIQRRKLGRIVYAPRAHAHIQDPTSLRAWYKQNLRWLWGTFQGVWGHRCGRKLSRFDTAYVLVMVDWLLYVLGGPMMVGLTTAGLLWDPVWFLIGVPVGYFVWTIPAAVCLRKWRLIPMTPLFIVIDWIYRVVFVHAFVRTLRQPLVPHCRWESPSRY